MQPDDMDVKLNWIPTDAVRFSIELSIVGRYESQRRQKMSRSGVRDYIDRTGTLTHAAMPEALRLSLHCLLKNIQHYLVVPLANYTSCLHMFTTRS
jgi:hypothetical protein